MEKDNARSLRDFMRAGGGGLIIGLPLLYTMEVWARGVILPWWKLLFLLGVAYLVVFGYNSIAGFRRERSYRQLAVDSISTLGLGVVIAFVALVALGRVEASTSLRDASGKIALEAIPIAFGASVATTQLGGNKKGGKGGRQGAGPLGRLLVGIGGAVLFALNVAPTDEIPILAMNASPWLLLTLVAASLLLTLALVFFADFGGRGEARGDRLLEQPWSETLTSYAASLGVSLLLLWAFGRTDGASGTTIVAMTVVLAAVASVGAAVGRLMVGGQGEAGEGK